MTEHATIGHNSAAGNDLKNLLERIERVAEEKKGLADDIKDLFTEAKSKGFDTKTMRKVLKIRAMDKKKYEEEQAILDVYLHSLGWMQ